MEDRQVRKVADVKEFKMTELDQYLFGQGRHYNIYKKLGSHIAEMDGETGVFFSVWAPNARYVSVVGEFNQWNRESHSMEKKDPLGIWEVRTLKC